MAFGRLRGPRVQELKSSGGVVYSVQSTLPEAGGHSPGRVPGATPWGPLACPAWICEGRPACEFAGLHYPSDSVRSAWSAVAFGPSWQDKKCNLIHCGWGHGGMNCPGRDGRYHLPFKSAMSSWLGYSALTRATQVRVLVADFLAASAGWAGPSRLRWLGLLRLGWAGHREFDGWGCRAGLCWAIGNSMVRDAGGPGWGQRARPSEIRWRGLGWPSGFRWLGMLRGAVLGHREFDGWG